MSDLDNIGPVRLDEKLQYYHGLVADLVAENARLQARVEDGIAVIDVAATKAVRLEREPDGYKALAERLREELRIAATQVHNDSLNRSLYPSYNLHKGDFQACPASVCSKRRAAIDASPE